MTQSMDGSITAGTGALEQSVPLTFSASSDVQWRVVSVDPAGTATVNVAVSNLTVSSNGQSQAVPSPPAVTVHVTRDGRIVSTSGLTISSGSGQFPGLNGNDQISTLLPDHAVNPGDSWSKSVTRTIFGSTVTFRTSGSYLRNERVGTVDAAVIQTKQTMPVRLTLTGTDLASFLPGLSGVIPAHAKVTYSGQVAGTGTTWIDPAAKRLLKSQVESRFSFEIAITGVSSAAGLGSFRMSGTESTTFTAR
jgi:hypothetical protein